MSALQRYDFPCGGVFDAYMTEGGRFVLFSEAQALNAELLEALEAMVVGFDEEDMTSIPQLKQARAALSRAKGK